MLDWGFRLSSLGRGWAFVRLTTAATGVYWQDKPGSVHGNTLSTIYHPGGRKPPAWQRYLTFILEVARDTAFTSLGTQTKVIDVVLDRLTHHWHADKIHRQSA